MSQINIEKVEVISQPKVKLPLSVRVTISWPIEDSEDDQSFSVSTVNDNGDIVNTKTVNATSHVINLKTDSISAPGSFAVVATGANEYQTRYFEPTFLGTNDPQSTGFIPIT